MVLYVLIYALWILLALATHVSLCVVVYKDAVGLPKPELGISSILWLGISFTLPILGMLIYWLMNYSNLKRSIKSDDTLF